MATSKQQDQVVQIDRINAETIIVPIVGTSPLIVHRFSEKAKKEMLDRAQGKKNPRQVKNPHAEYEAAAYTMTDSNGKLCYGFPAIAFKAATVSAARFYRDVKMTELRQFLFFGGEVGGEDRIALIKIYHDKGEVAPGEDWPRMREDVVRVGMGAADLRYRPEFWPWRADLKITYVTSQYSRDSVLSIVDAGGFGVGVGDWRPEKRGSFGCYEIDTGKQIRVVK